MRNAATKVLGLGVGALLLCGCLEDVGEQAAPVRSARQAGGGLSLDGGLFEKLPAPANLDDVLYGTEASARLGALLAGCPDGGFIAGAPGTGEVAFGLSTVNPAWASPSGLTPETVNGVGCENDPLSDGLVVATSTALYRRVDGGANGSWVQVRAGTVTALAVTPGPSSRYATGATSGAQVIFLSNGNLANLSLMDGGVLLATSLAWAAGGERLAAADEQGRVHVFEYRAVHGSFGHLATVGRGTAGTAYPLALAFGDVMPPVGEELVVGYPSQAAVDVHGLGAGFPRVNSLSAPSAGALAFGAALVVEPRPIAGQVHALWVGDPGQSVAYRYVGDAGERLDPDAGDIDFGATLAFSGPSTLLVGAPGASARLGGRTGMTIYSAGAVYPYTLPSSTVFGVPTTCSAGASCTYQCHTGTCLGGILCTFTQEPLGGCADGGSPQDGGADDAGTGADDAGTGADDAGTGADDAGTGADDAGTGADDAGAGADDAGAGADDAGAEARLAPVDFTTSGCTTTGALSPVTLLLALLLRRRGHVP